MTRYFLTLAYHGARFNGWQIQPDAPSVQETLEQACSTILRQPISITGCGRTDTGVHARYYVAHFDAEGELPGRFVTGVNSLLPDDIAVYSARAMHPEAHARYDAYERSYVYYLSLRKDPFSTQTAWFYPQNKLLNLEKMQQTADLLPQYDTFFPFCKTHSGVDSYHCELKTARWEHRPEEHLLLFHITANRFLRGMVRLIVGACIQTGIGQITIEEVQAALNEQKTLKKSLSVPPQGLFLTDVKYPYEL
ncbi:MAG TPA: tRNA pseudouridine(38-40) synthase TruA [Saprospiraceae bacterium]|nr:tRNA pseudouridine(38-40) synthase TruA [Saprospiraceae bacterium]HPI09336.1 tRNA pseudouridine(38-40) synthase TruA [Saprospiraceae bacterium]